MHKLLTELQRLYFLPQQSWQMDKTTRQNDLEMLEQVLAGTSTADLNLVSPEGKVRVLLLNFKRSSDWTALSEFCQALQDELELPEPAISIAGEDGYQLWFSLAEAVTLEQGSRFLTALQHQYLSGIPAHHLLLRPLPEASSDTFSMVPMHLPNTGNWLAFIDPSLGSMFADEQWLEMAPNMDQQANRLASLASIKAGTFNKVVEQLQLAATEAAIPPRDNDQRPASASTGKASRPRLNIDTPYADPVSFLLAVMNDNSASARQRIRAAKALLPYFPATEK